MTLKVVAAIHWEALKIWRKGMKINTCPEEPEAKIVYGDGSGAISGVKPSALSAPATTGKAEYVTS